AVRIPHPVGQPLPHLLSYFLLHDAPALGDPAARVASTHSTGTARDDHCPIIKPSHDFFPCLAKTIRTGKRESATAFIDLARKLLGNFTDSLRQFLPGCGRLHFAIK